MPNSDQAKTINGHPVTNVVFRRTICEAFATMENDTGGVDDLVPLLGPEHGTPRGRRLLSSTLNNLVRSRRLKRDPDIRGLYVLSKANFKRNGVSSTSKLEDNIAEVLRAAGGFATAAQVLEEFGLRPHGEDESELRRRRTRAQWNNYKDGDDVPIFSVANTYDYKAIYAVLRTSQRIRQDYIVRGRNGASVTVDRLYNLPQHELAALPLRGYFVGVITKATYEDLGLAGYKDVRDAQFRNVGDVFREARKARKLTSTDLARRKGVAAALLDLTRDELIDGDNRSIYQADTQKRVEEMRAAGATQDEVMSLRERRDDARNGPECMGAMLERFELADFPHGNRIHLRAPVSFYVALASELGIDPIAATRGLLQIDVSGERIRVDREGPDWERVAAREEARERTLEVRAGKRKSITSDARLKP